MNGEALLPATPWALTHSRRIRSLRYAQPVENFADLAPTHERSSAIAAWHGSMTPEFS